MLCQLNCELQRSASKMAWNVMLISQVMCKPQTVSLHWGGGGSAYRCRCDECTRLEYVHVPMTNQLPCDMLDYTVHH